MASLDWLASIIASYGYVALFLASVIEGPIATVIGAFLASQGLLHVGVVYAIAVSGDLVGDLLCYGVGRSGRLPGLRWHAVSGARQQQRFAMLKTRFHAHAGSTLLAGKLTHAAGFLVLLAAGAARIPMARFLWFNLLGTLPKTALFVLIGYFAGAAYHRIDAYLWIASCAVFVLIFLGVGLYVRRRVRLEPPEA
ncbi:hypothetical protein C5O80_37515 [Burkholderia sp. SRS-46]|nr:hypothetical protein C5O80_37515 [Burkholderia sp. SRS-46]